MKNLIFILFLLSLSSSLFAMGVVDDPLLTKLTIGQLENRSTSDESTNVLEGEFWVGRDLNKIWAKFGISGLGESNSKSDISLWVSKAYDYSWDIQYGIRSINNPSQNRNYIGVAFKGLAPYWIGTDAQLLVSEEGQLFLDLRMEYEYMLTQRWLVISEAKFNIYNEDDTSLEIGSGLASSEIGLRIGYEIKREITPYIGLNFENLYGTTADFAKENNEKTSDEQLVIGLKMWF